MMSVHLTALAREYFAWIYLVLTLKLRKEYTGHKYVRRMEREHDSFHDSKTAFRALILYAQTTPIPKLDERLHKENIDE
jgi:hypothetical protein